MMKTQLLVRWKEKRDKFTIDANSGLIRNAQTGQAEAGTGVIAQLNNYCPKEQ